MNRRAFHITGTVYIVIAMIVGGVIGFLDVSGQQLTTVGMSVFYSLIALMVVLALAVSLLWWRAIDEASREAHKWAWLWGGSCGLLIVMAIYFLSVLNGGELGRSLMSYFNVQGSGFEFGIITGVVPPVIGYGIAWGIWWLRHR